MDSLKSEWYDHTKLSLYRLCPQKYEYRIVENLVTKDTEWALAFGIAIHKALETIYDGSYVQRDEKGTYRYQSVFLELYPKEPPKGYRTRVTGVELLTQYIAKWHSEPFKVVEIEAPFTVQIPNDAESPDFHLMGRIDLVVEWDGEVMPLDHKTTSYFGEHFELGFKVDAQPTLYMYALGARRCVINALRVSAKINDESFVRKITTRTPEEIARTLHDVKKTVSDIRASRALSVWPRHGSQSCFAYNRTCEYYALCSSSDQQAATLKETMYDYSVWQPV